MAQDGSIAPQERINITYKPSTGGAQTEVELPLKLLFLGDFTGRQDPTPLEDRRTLGVDKDNFQKVLAEQNVRLTVAVPDKLSETPNATMSVSLKFASLGDFGPESVAQQVPELRKLLELRQALTALKGPLGNIPAFRRKIQELLGDSASRERLLGELGLGESKEGT